MKADCANCPHHACYTRGANCTGVKEEEIRKAYTEEERKIMEAAAYVEGTYYSDICRLQETAEFAKRMGYKKLGFLGGMLASNYDVKTVFIDAFLKLIKIDLADAKWFFDSLEKYAQKHDVTFVLSVSADPEALPDFCKGYII